MTKPRIAGRHRMNRGMAFCTTAFLFAVLSSAARPVLADDTFDRTFKITGPTTRIELNNASGNVDIHSGQDGQVHIHGKVSRGGWSLFGNSENSVREEIGRAHV